MKNILGTLGLILLITSAVAQQQELVEEVSLCNYSGKSYVYTKGVTITATPTCSFVISGLNGPFFIKPAGASLVSKNIPPSLDKNFVREENILKSGVTIENQIPDLLDNEKSVQYRYIDGLGRLNETVNVKTSPLKNDIILATYFDNMGHKRKEYLPYTHSQQNGAYRSAYDAESKTFYSSSPKVGFENLRTFKEDIYENSSLDRITDAYDAGNEWYTAARRNQSHVRVEADPTVKRWVYVDDNTPPTISTYDTLLVNVSIDEENHVTREFIDKRGLTILKQTLETGNYITTPGSVTWLETYFIYDDLGLLKTIVPPEAVSRIGTEYVTDNNTKNEFLQRWCFQFRYDAVQNMTKRWLPGWTDWEYMVYDKWNRKILTQTPAQRTRNEWTFTKYDLHNRAVMTGLWVTTTSYTSVTQGAESSPNRFETSNSTPEGYTLTSTYPTAVSATDIIAITYYDNYTFLNNTNWDAEGPNSNYSPVNIPGFPSTSMFLTNATGHETGSKVKVLGQTKWLNTVKRYDNKYRAVQVISENNLGGRDRLATNYNFAGKILQTQTYHTSSSTTLTVFREYMYDHANRLTKLYQTTDNGTRVLLRSNVYNEVGQLVEKNTHSLDDGLTNLQSVDYRYNVRGWLTSINNSTLTNDGSLNDDNNDIFGMELLYNPATLISINTDPSGTFTTSRLYDGTISAVKWKIDNKVNAPVENIYVFDYDQVKRFKKAYFASKNAGTWTSNVGFYDEHISSYDKNGNINSILRNGKVNGVKAPIDNLSLTYVLNGKRANRLIKVEDASGNPLGYVNGANIAEEFMFDASGNLKFDINKQISDIQYNHLNLPTQIQFTRPGAVVDRIKYTYDGNGVKLKTTVYKNGSSSSDGTLVWLTDYSADLQYDNNTLTFAKTPEGRVLKNTSGFDYEYFHKDRHGNIRATYGLLSETVFHRATMEKPIDRPLETPPGSTLADKEQQTFSNVSTTRHPDPVFNYTTSSAETVTPDKSSITNAFLNKPIGPAKFLTVSAGDRVKMEVFAKYSQVTGSNATIASATLISAVTGSFNINPGELLYSGFNTNVPLIPGTGSASPTLPKAYLAYLFFDSNDIFVTSAAVAISASAHNAFEKLERTFTASQNGKLYVYVANEANVSNSVSVFFDEMLIVHQKNNKSLQVTQASDYYPFGLAFNTFQAQRMKDDYSTVQKNRYGFQGQELQKDLDLGWSEFKYRMHDPSTGRFNAVDPLAVDYSYNSPYAFQENKLGSGTELEGLELNPWTVYKIGQFFYSISPAATMEKGGYAMMNAAAVQHNYATSRGEQYQQAIQNNTSINAIEQTQRVKEWRANAELADVGMELWFWSASGAIGALENAATNIAVKQTIKVGESTLRKATAKLEESVIKEEFSVSFGAAKEMATKGGNNLVQALSKVGGSRSASEFLGWGNKTTILKSASDFTAGQLTKAGYTKQVLTEIHSGLMEAAKKTIPSTGQLNPASVARANQIQEILTMHFK